MSEKNENELKEVENMLLDVEKLINSAEMKLQNKLQTIIGVEDLSEKSLDDISALNAKLEVIKQAGNNLYYRKQRLVKGLGYMPDDEDDSDEEGSIFFKVLNNETKLRNVQFLYA